MKLLNLSLIFEVKEYRKVIFSSHGDPKILNLIFKNSSVEFIEDIHHQEFLKLTFHNSLDALRHSGFNFLSEHAIDMIGTYNDLNNKRFPIEF